MSPGAVVSLGSIVSSALRSSTRLHTRPMLLLSRPPLDRALTLIL